MEDEKLKPCPFCGKELVAQDDLFYGGALYTHTEDCIHKLLDSKDFRKLWNNRPKEEALQKQVDELTAKLKHWKAVIG